LFIVRQIFNANPSEDSLLDAKLSLYLDLTNTTDITSANFNDIYSGIIKDRASSALWFYPAAVGIHLPSPAIPLLTNLSPQGSTILALVLLSLIKGLPRGE
jgi:hypothetical protein